MYPHICYTVSASDRPTYTMWENRPGWAAMVRTGDLLIAGKNFGIGSSRPAAANLKSLGIACVLAESVNGLFLRNAVNFGLPVASVPRISSSVSEGDVVTADMDYGKVTINSARVLNFKPIPHFLMDIVDSGGIIEVLKKRGLLEESPSWD